MIVKNVEKKENNSALFQVECDPAQFEQAVAAAYRKNKSSIYIPGFRKGKAPRAVVEGMYGKEVFYQEAMDELAPDAFELGLSESGLRTVGSPSISDVKVTDDTGVVFTFAVTLYPEVTLGQYKGLSAPKAAEPVTDEDVAAELENTRKRNARKVSVEDRPAQMGDTVVIDFDGFLDGERFDGGKAEGHSLVLGSHSFVPGFEEQVVGMSVGEEKDLDITFPEDYHEGLAGKAVVFKVKLHSITEDELPELDDEFAKDVSEFDTLEEYKADVKQKLQKERDEKAENVFRAEILRQAAENMNVEIPQVMLAEKAEEIVRNYAANFGMSDRNVPLEKLLQMMGLDQQSMNSFIMPSAEQQVKQELLLEAVAAAENLEVSEEEAEEYVKKVAENVQASVEEIKKYFGADYIAAEKKREKATDLILSSAVVGEAPAKEEEEKKEEE